MLASTSSAELNGFSAPVTLSGKGASSPRVAVDPDGRATVVWSSRAIQAVRLGAAGDPGPVQTLSMPGHRGLPEVAVDPEGRATVVWRRFDEVGDGSNSGIEGIRIDAAGDPGPGEALSSALFPSDPRVAVDPEGRATVVWADEDGDCPNQVVQAMRLDPAGHPGPVQALSRYGDCGFTPAPLPDVAVDSAGVATVVWRRLDASNSGVLGARLDAAGSPGPVQALSETGQSASPPQVAVDPEGRATVVWSLTTRPRAVQAVHIDSAGDPGPVETLSEAGSQPQVAVDAAGRATVVWRRSDGSNVRVQAARLDAAGNPGPVQTLSGAGQNALGPQVAVDAAGRATVVWRSPNPARVQAVRLDGAGGPRPVQTVGETHRRGAPRVAVDPEGRATVVWSDSNGRVQAARSLRLFAVRAKPERRKVGPGRKRVSIRFRATNRDTEPSGVVRLCARAPKRKLKIKGRRCVTRPNAVPGQTRKRVVRVRIRRRLRGKTTGIKLIARGSNVEARTTARLSVRR